MGSGRWDSNDWATYSSSVKSKPAAAIYTSTGLKSSLDPKGIKLRESRDSKDNPASTAIIVALDVTGSMGVIAENMAKEGLGVLFTEVLTRKPVMDPHIMFMAVGDVNFDRAPFQVSQFEASNVIVDQLTEIFVEGGGGGNQSESYSLPWYFAATKTSIDCFEKRGKKGYLFTIGDEMTPPTLTGRQLTEVLGDKVSQDVSCEEAYKMASRMYNVFHIIVDQGDFAKRVGADNVGKAWKALMGQNAIHLADYTKLSEVIVSLIQVIEGESIDAVAKSWTGKTAVTVKSAIKDLVPTKGKRTSVKEVVRL